MDMDQHWNHLCGKQRFRLAVSECCPVCGINVAVESVRYHGHEPNITVQNSDWLGRVFATARPKNKKKTVDTNQHDYYDRHG